MLRALQLLVFILGVAFFVSLAGLAYYSAPPANPNDQQTTAQTTEKKPQEAQNIRFAGFVHFLFPDAISIFTFWLVVATIVLGVVAYAQIDFLKRAEVTATNAATAAKNSADAEKKAADTSREALVKSQRAFVRAAGYPWLWRPDFDRPGKYFFDISPIVENAGATPTVDMKIVVDYAIRETPLPDGFDFPLKSNQEIRSSVLIKPSAPNMP